jgi:hypothetical protein
MHAIGHILHGDVGPVDRSIDRPCLLRPTSLRSLLCQVLTGAAAQLGFCCRTSGYVVCLGKLVALVAVCVVAWVKFILSLAN